MGRARGISGRVRPLPVPGLSSPGRIGTGRAGLSRPYARPVPGRYNAECYRGERLTSLGGNADAVDPFPNPDDYDRSRGDGGADATTALVPRDVSFVLRSTRAICGLCLVYPKATAAILGRPVTYSVDQNRLEAGSRKECRLKWDGKPSTAVAITTSQSVDESREQTSALRS